MTNTGVTISPVNIKNRQEIDIQPGDTVRVWQKVHEADKIRLQPFEGVVLACKHGSEAGATFTVRRVNDPYGTEKIFPLYSPMIDKIEIIKRAGVRRAKLYHIRKKAAREIKRQMRNLRFVDIASASDTEEKAAEAEKSEKAEKSKDVETPTESTEAENEAIDKKEEKVEAKEEKETAEEGNEEEK